MDDGAPVEVDRFLVADPEELDIGAVDEASLAVELGHPHRHRRGIGDQPEALLALAKRGLGDDPLGDVIAVGEDAADRAVRIEDRLEDEVEQPFLARPSGRRWSRMATDRPEKGSPLR